MKNKLCITLKDWDSISEEKKKILSSYKEELKNLQQGISVKSAEDEKIFKKLHSEKIDLSSKLDTTTFKLNEAESELTQKKQLLREFVDKFEWLNKEYHEVSEAKRVIEQEF